MNQSQPFSDHNIRQTIEAIRSDGQNVTPWAVQSRLGGGDFLRIQQIIDQFFPAVNQPAQEVPSNSANNNASQMSFTAPTNTSHRAAHKSPAAPLSSTRDKPSNQDFIDKQMPTDIEASMYNMQTALGQMANQIWSDAADNAQEQVRGKLFSAQQAHEEAKQSLEEALAVNKQMESTIHQLSDQTEQLNHDYQTTVKKLKSEQQALQDTLVERDRLQQNVENLESENQALEQKAFNSNIEAAKAQGLADIIKEQLALAKQSEKQLQKALDRSEKKVNELNRELHSSGQSLRDELRDRQIPMHPPKRPKPTPEQINQQYPPQELPSPSAADIKPAQPLAPSAAEPQNEAIRQIPAAAATPVPPPKGSSIEDLGHSLVLNRAHKASQAKTRTLTDKLFDRKKHPFKNKKK